MSWLNILRRLLENPIPDEETIGDLSAKKIDVMIKEYESMTQAIKLLSNAIIRDFQIFLAFLAALFAFSSRTNPQESSIIDMKTVICLTPFLIFSFGLFFLAKFSQMLSDSAYTSYIEKKVNEALHAPVLNWESTMSRKLLFTKRSSFAWCSLLFGLTILAAYVLTAYAGIRYTTEPCTGFYGYSLLFKICYWGCPGLFLILLILAGFERKTSAERIKQLADANKP